MIFLDLPDDRVRIVIMKIIKKILRIGITVSIAFALTTTSGLCLEKTTAVAPEVLCANGKLSIQTKNTPLSKVVEEIGRKCRVAISGLEQRANEPLSFTAQEEIQETALKRFLRQLGEESYAFEYTRSGLNRIVVLPRSNAKYSPAPMFPPKTEPALPFPPPAPQPAEAPPGVSVMDVIQGSQGESIGLQKGDVVLEYDGVKITDSQQLIQEVKNRETKDVVELTVLRNNTPMSFVLKGGFIGVNIANGNPK